LRIFLHSGHGHAYSIGEFARLSGITATTLRAWQRRYGLLKPQRTEGGHRQYSDEDVQQALKSSTG
jgi:DNA-binding transcriptional MerR regulator